jgi:large subunit ribosomal protein L21
MHAVIKTGGKQHRVKQGDVIKVEKLKGNSGDPVEFGDVLMLYDPGSGSKVGSPLVEHAKVRGKILGHEKGKKIIIFKFRRKKGYRRKKGHRQVYTSVEITDIET